MLDLYLVLHVKTQQFSINRFYDEKLPINSQKEVYAGVGEFKLIVIKDSKPAYDFRETSNGKKFVNTRIFDAKDRYRELTGGGHKIHGTNNLSELKHDIVLLLGVSLSDFLKIYDNPTQSRQEIVLQQDLPGSNGWQSFEELFYVLNECVEYIVLRNSDTLSLDHFKENNGDVDLLVKNRVQCQYILGDLSCIDNDYKVDSNVSVNNQIIPFEIYEVGENLFDEKYEDYLFINKIKKDTFFCLPPKIELYTLIYHAILFHKNISNKHLRRIENNSLCNELLNGASISKENLFLSLLEFFESIGCTFIAPNDDKIFFNSSLAAGRNLALNKKRPNIFKANLRKIFRYQKFSRFSKISLFFCNTLINIS